jgi:hypothetical protein
LTFEGAKSTRVSSWNARDLDPPLTAPGPPPAILRGVLTSDDGSGRYLLVDGEGWARQVRFKDEDVVKPLSPGDANPWGLRRPHHLLDLELEPGSGDGSSEGLVVLEARLLEKTTVFPLELESTLASLRDRTRAAFEAQASDFDARMLDGAVRARKRLAPRKLSGKATPLREPQVADAVSGTARWDERRQVLVVTTRRLHQEEHPGEDRTESPRCAPGEPCRERVVTPVARATTLMAVRQLVSAQGHLVEETTFAPITTIEEFSR